MFVFELGGWHTCTNEEIQQNGIIETEYICAKNKMLIREQEANQASRKGWDLKPVLKMLVEGKRNSGGEPTDYVKYSESWPNETDILLASG